MTINWWMDNQNVFHLSKEHYSAVKENKIMELSGKWMDLEIITLSEVIQIQKDKQQEDSFYIYA